MDAGRWAEEHKALLSAMTPAEAAAPIELWRERAELGSGLTIEVDGQRPIPARTPRVTRNPAAGIMVSAFGGELPATA
jgi:hypothetical protein